MKMEIRHSGTILEFDKIKEELASYALMDQAKEKISALAPSLRERECRAWLEETTQARGLLDTLGTPPLTGAKELQKALQLSAAGSMLSPDELESVAQFASACKRMKQYLSRGEEAGYTLAACGRSMGDLDALREEIERSIRAGRVDDAASPALRSIRRKMENVQSQVKSKLQNLLRQKPAQFSDGFVSNRGGHFVLPVKKEYKNQFPGRVIDVSGSGGTYFMEPDAVAKYQREFAALQIEEENEIRTLLYTLTALVDEHLDTIKLNLQALETLDFAFAKAKLSSRMQAREPELTLQREIRICGGRHPLLRAQGCVPLDFQIGAGTRGVVITGPNTGGKTVALKTVGLLCMMAQSGLHVPAGEGSRFCLSDKILCDIGDGQSITENLSTFSAHMKNIVGILGGVTAESLVLLDELGSGTDPAEGMGIAVAILAQLARQSCLFVATTHYPQVKEFAQRTPGLLNARMAYDRESLLPLYRLEMGEAGESCALSIAQRLGFPEHLLRLARQASQSGIQAGLDCDTAALTSRAGAVIAQESRPANEPQRRFQTGDSVQVLPEKETGIVVRSGERGQVLVQVRKEKKWVSYKRIQLLVPAQELYPPDYDFSIVFDTVQNRKARRQMQKHHSPDLTVVYENVDGTQA